MTPEINDLINSQAKVTILKYLTARNEFLSTQDVMTYCRREKLKISVATVKFLLIGLTRRGYLVERRVKHSIRGGATVEYRKNPDAEPWHPPT